MWIGLSLILYRDTVELWQTRRLIPGLNKARADPVESRLSPRRCLPGVVVDEQTFYSSALPVRPPFLPSSEARSRSPCWVFRGRGTSPSGRTQEGQSRPSQPNHGNESRMRETQVGLGQDPRIITLTPKPCSELYRLSGCSSRDGERSSGTEEPGASKLAVACDMMAGTRSVMMASRPEMCARERHSPGRPFGVADHPQKCQGRRSLKACPDRGQHLPRRR